MGVYVALGAPIYEFDAKDSIALTDPSLDCSLDKAELLFQEHEKVLIFMAEGTHKTKKKAEQIACEKAIRLLNP